ncbi:MAG: response regulator [Flavobacteriales bacterium]|jgi:CheY-like chemotaxis protein|nr:response regulator [Flavobacteriales bacterium]MBP7156330.1 response regulator [Flavobacteriales bacterium]HQV75666.1 response regulator [Flavobacteriales bacterium]HQW41670.1 response regulator [Flavobacteriales bacterium]
MELTPPVFPAVDHILVIDDDDDCNFVTKLVLKQAGYRGQLTCLTSVEQALLHLRGAHAKPDLLFIDINLPPFSGFDLLHTCETEGLLPNGHSTVVMFSSSNRPHDINKALSFKSVSSYVEKALSVEAFQRISLDHARRGSNENPPTP